MFQRLASCSCGQLTAQVVGEPVRVSICHCLACQRRTGSVFGQQARFRRENVSLSGTSSEHVRVGDEGSRVRFHFCPSCGSAGGCGCRIESDDSAVGGAGMAGLLLGIGVAVRRRARRRGGAAARQSARHVHEYEGVMCSLDGCCCRPVQPPPLPAPGLELAA